MLAIATYGPTVRRVRDATNTLGYGLAVDPHGVLLIGQYQFQEPARGIVWDYRGFEFG